MLPSTVAVLAHELVSYHRDKARRIQAPDLPNAATAHASATLRLAQWIAGLDHVVCCLPTGRDIILHHFQRAHTQQWHDWRDGPQRAMPETMEGDLWILATGYQAALEQHLPDATRLSRAPLLGPGGGE
jgi:hypothetical protein